MNISLFKYFVLLTAYSFTAQSVTLNYQIRSLKSVQNKESCCTVISYYFLATVWTPYGIGTYFISTNLISFPTGTVLPSNTKPFIICPLNNYKKTMAELLFIDAMALFFLINYVCSFSLPKVTCTC